MTDAGRNRARRKTPEWLQRKERGNAFWIALMSRLSLKLGRRLSRVVLYGIAFYFVFAAAAARRASRAYLERILARPVGWRDLYRHTFTFAGSIHDRIYLLNDRYDLFDIRISGAEPLLALHAEHKGCLLFGAHLGSFEVLRSIAREVPGLKISAAMFPDNARLLNETLAAINPGLMFDVIELGRMEAMLTLHQRLQDGVMVGVLADRASGPDKYLQKTFLGTPASFPTGPFRMAAMLRQPVYFMSGLYRGGNRYDIQFDLLEDFSGPPGASREAEVDALLTSYVAALERHCRTAPFNWFNFYDFWNPADRETP